MRASWWRVNRRWLALVPVAVGLAMLASAYRVDTFWWQSGLHHEIASAEPGASATVVDDFTDNAGRTTRRFSVRFARLEKVEEIPTSGLSGSSTPPPGTTAYAVHLEFRAAPDQTMASCHVELLDSDGNEYTADSFPQGQVNICVPEGHEGPALAQFKDQRRGAVEAGHERPGTWRVAPVLVVKEGVRITEARVWWTYPAYVSLAAPR